MFLIVKIIIKNNFYLELFPQLGQKNYFIENIVPPEIQPEHLRMAHLLAAVSLPPVTFRPAGEHSLRFSSKTQAIRAASLEEIPPNVVRRKLDSTWRGGFSLGVDLGLARTGLALSKGFNFRPLTVTQFHPQSSHTPTKQKHIHMLKTLIWWIVGSGVERTEA